MEETAMTRLWARPAATEASNEVAVERMRAGRFFAALRLHLLFSSFLFCFLFFFSFAAISPS
jgi:hypothetical protein